MMKGFPETAHVFQIDSPGQSIAGMVLKPWDERSRTSNQLQPVVQQQLNQVAGVRMAAFQLPPLPGSQGLPVQFVITTTDSFNQLDEVAQQFLQEARQQRNVHLSRYRSQDRQPGIGRGDRPQQGRAARTQDERRRQRHGLDARRRLRELFQPRSAFIQGDPAGPAALSPQHGSTAELLRGQRQWRSRSAVDRSRTSPPRPCRNRSITFSSSTARPSRASRHQASLRPTRSTFSSASPPNSAAGLYGRLQRPVAPICAGIQRLRRDLRLCARHHLPFAGRVVRELPRSIHHPGVGADVDCRRADFHQRRRRAGRR